MFVPRCTLGRMRGDRVVKVDRVGTDATVGGLYGAVRRMQLSFVFFVVSVFPPCLP